MGQNTYLLLLFIECFTVFKTKFSSQNLVNQCGWSTLVILVFILFHRAFCMMLRTWYHTNYQVLQKGTGCRVYALEFRMSSMQFQRQFLVSKQHLFNGLDMNFVQL